MPMIEKMNGVTSGGSFGLPPAAEKLLSTVADALAPTVTDTPSNPNWMDKQRAGSVAIKTNTQNELLHTMMSLGFYTVTKDAAIALIASGHKLPIAEIDAKLAKANVSLQDRIKLKAAMDKYRIIGR